MKRLVIQQGDYSALSEVVEYNGGVFNRIYIFKGEIDFKNPEMICEVDIGHKAAYNMARSYIRRESKHTQERNCI